MLGGFFNRMSRAYLGCLTRSPMITKSLSATGLFVFGDTMAQCWEQRHDEKFIYDSPRGARMAFMGFSSGTLLHVWYGFLNTRIRTTTVAVWGVIGKVLADQLLFSPLSLASLLIGTNLIAGRSVDEVSEAVKNDFPPLLKMNYAIWPAVMFINFLYVPIPYQVLVTSTVSVFWSSYSSHVINESIPKNQKPKLYHIRSKAIDTPNK